MFQLDSDQIYRVAPLSQFEWLIHGFGTCYADIPAAFTNLATLKQIHSALAITACARAGVLGEGDALLEDTPGAVVAVKTADCVPILLIDARRRAVAAVHAGWRGTVERIVPSAIAAMGDRFRTDPADLHAALGPAIGKCCYEVGPDVAVHFGQPGRAFIGLEEANRQQLQAAGVPPGHIYASNLCTMCRPGEFHSFRRDKQAAGRLYSYAGIIQP